ncbi:MAG: transporter substrate-binding domain-containing protein [Saprospiraceae bacterium]
MPIYRQLLVLLLCFNAFIANGLNDTLKVAYTRAAPFIITDSGQPEGISVWLWDKIARNLDMEYELVEMGFGAILQGLENGTVDGSINSFALSSMPSAKYYS